MPPKRLDSCMVNDCDAEVKWVISRYTKRNLWSFSCDRHLKDVAFVVTQLSPSIVVRRYE